MDKIEKSMANTIYEIFLQAAENYSEQIALTFIEDGKASSEPVNLSYHSLLSIINQTGNLFHELGIKNSDVVSILLPNLLETHFALWGSQAVAIASPINPFLEAHAISDILIATQSQILVTLAESDDYKNWEKIKQIAQKTPELKYILTVSLSAKVSTQNHHIQTIPNTSVKVMDFTSSVSRQDSSTIKAGYNADKDQLSAFFHTGGTTGTPKIAQLSHANQLFMASTFNKILRMTQKDRAMGGLPLFHVNAIYTAGLSLFLSGANVLILGADGFRNKSCVRDFWSVVAKYRATLFSGVPTFYSALLSVPIEDNNIKSLRVGAIGAAPASSELFKQIERVMGINVIEGYGLTEGSCVSTVNPYDGIKKVGSIGLPIPEQELKIVKLDDNYKVVRNCSVNESGVIIIRGPNVFQGYLNDVSNRGVLLKDGWLNTGDLGRLDEDNYVWLTGREKDLIIRGGHNIDPKMIEDSLAQHPDVALVAAIGQPDTYAGELPIAYVTLVDGAEIDSLSLINFAKSKISERAATPVYLEILKQMPMTAVGKIFKPELRRNAISRVLSIAFSEAALEVDFDVINSKKDGLTIIINDTRNTQSAKTIVTQYGLSVAPE